MKYFCVLFLLLATIQLRAQVEDYDEEHIVSSLVNFSSLNTSLEFYEFNGGESAISLVANATFEFGQSDYVNVELIGARYSREGQIQYTQGDFSISYSKNLYSKYFLDPGFQGWAPSLKVVLPTGDPDFAGLFGHWIAEPSVYYSWLLNNEKFFLSNRWRLFLPLINVSDAAEPPRQIRFEPRFGYETDAFWTSVTLDNRWVFNQDAYVLFYRLDGGYKIDENSGISLFVTQRIVNTVLFKFYAGFAYYHLF